jgi:hypothetical protein
LILNYHINMSSIKTTGGRGGAGRGQGRKPLHEVAMKPVSIKMTDQQREKLLALGGSPWVRSRIDGAKVPVNPKED